MKKIIFSFFSLLAITISMVSWKQFSANGRAKHVEGDDCIFIISKNTTGDPNSRAYLETIGSYKYEESPNGNARLTCKGSAVIGGHNYNETGHAYVVTDDEWNGGCYVPGSAGVTRERSDEWRVIVDAKGKATCECHWNHIDKDAD